LKNDPNNVKLSRGVILCVIVARKSIKVGKLQTSQKIIHKMSYHVRGFMTFRSNNQCYGYNRGIVWDNVSILCIHVHLGMSYNVAGGSFSFQRTKKAISLFWGAENRMFCEETTKLKFQIGTNTFFKNTRSPKMTNFSIVVSGKFLNR
jgi:hypothetical protein